MTDHDADVVAVLADETYRQQWGQPPRTAGESRMYMPAAKGQLTALTVAGYAVVKVAHGARLVYAAWVERHNGWGDAYTIEPPEKGES